MSKTTIFLILLFLGVGVVISIFTNFKPLTAIRNFMENPSTVVPWFGKAWQFIQQNLVGFVTGIMAMLAIAGKAYSNYKQSRQQIEQSLQTQVAEISKAKTELEGSKEELETQLSTQQTQYTDTVTKLSNQLADTQQDYHTTVEQLKTVTDERNMFVNKFQASQKELEEYRKKFGTLYVK